MMLRFEVDHAAGAQVFASQKLVEASLPTAPANVGERLPNHQGSASQVASGETFESSSVVISKNTPCFVVEEQSATPHVLASGATSQNLDVTERFDPASPQEDFLEFSATPSAPGSESSWREEVSARLNKYQARKRPREPRYPSLQLRFESQETRSGISPAVLHGSALTDTQVAAPSPREVKAPPREPTKSSEATGRLIEFPRFSAPPINTQELAEPVFERPRIMEAPEVVPPPPALGGILIEKIDAPSNERRPGFEMPLQAARMARRVAATLIDALIVLIGVALFITVFWRMTSSIPTPKLAALIGALAGFMLWTGYQYLLIIYCATTPGLKLAKLQLNQFCGSSVSRKMRRWRVLASVLSGLSLGLGYVWCFLDEDQLCWHDRITRTYIAPKAP